MLLLAACGTDTVTDGLPARATSAVDDVSAAGGAVDSAGEAAPPDEHECSAPADADDNPPLVEGLDQVESSPRDDSPSALDAFPDESDELPPPAIPLNRLRSGGPPPDGIPSIDDPQFHAAADITHLAPCAPVIALEIDGDARAYPLDVLIWHEIVNDTVGGVPVAVNYCPLCNSVTVWERDVDGQVLDFGVSGLLYNSSLVMYDRQTETLWSHLIGRGLYGVQTDRQLVSRPSAIVSWADWLDEHPDGLVLSRDTGQDRRYGANPYPGYDKVNSTPFLFDGRADARLLAMMRVIGVSDGDAAVAMTLDTLRDDSAFEFVLDGRPLVAFWQPGTASALDTAAIELGNDVGATGVFEATVDGQELTFAATDDGFVDDQTGTTWNLFGRAIAGELEGTELVPVSHLDTFWFAWAAFQPTTTIAE